MSRRILICFLAAVLATNAAAQARPPDLGPQRPAILEAFRLADQGQLSLTDLARVQDHPLLPWVEVTQLRRELATTPARFVIHVSADMRYRLYVNGEEVSAGPARSDVAHWRYETIDLAPHLRPGRNVLAAVVWNWGALRPLAQMSHRTAFLVQGEGLAADLVDTGPSWRALTNPAYGFRPVVPPDSGDFYAAAPGEKIDARLYPWGWERVGFDDSGWTAAVPSVGLPGEGAGAAAAGTSAFGWASDWQLEPRRLPMPEARPQRFAQLRRAEGVAADDRLTAGRNCIYVYMQLRKDASMDELTVTFAALADPTRRAMLTRLSQGPATVNELAAPFPLSLPTVSRHLQVLERAGLVQSERESRLIHYRADFAGMRRLLTFLMEDCCQGAPEMCGDLMAGITCEPFN